jgi:acetyl-CoA carboxylase carboxyl transferase subunit alpha
VELKLLQLSLHSWGENAISVGVRFIESIKETLLAEIEGLDFERPVVELEKKIEELKKLDANGKVDFSQEIASLETKCDELKKEIFGNLTPWQKVQLARHPRRPYTMDYINLLLTDFVELRGDRNFADDPAIVAGMAKFENQTVMVIGHQKGRTLQENMMRNFGMPHPEGYRKALRLMKLAEKFLIPVISFIDTPGAYPGIGAEERGQAEAIAQNLKVMSELEVPIIVVVIGEGGSGGALGIGVGDKVLMLENAIYSVISPEGCASILWKDAAKAPEAAKALKLTARDLLELKVIDEIIEEPLGGGHRDIGFMGKQLAEKIKIYLNELKNLPVEELLRNRYQKFRLLGEFVEEEPTRKEKTDIEEEKK